MSDELTISNAGPLPNRDLAVKEGFGWVLVMEIKRCAMCAENDEHNGTRPHGHDLDLEGRDSWEETCLTDITIWADVGAARCCALMVPLARLVSVAAHTDIDDSRSITYMVCSPTRRLPPFQHLGPCFGVKMVASQ